ISASPGGTASTNLSGTGQQDFTLTVATSGATGTDKLSSSDGFIDCGNGATTCSHVYTVSSSAPTPTITATTDTNSRFVGFSGDCTGSACQPTMSADHTNIVGSWQTTFVASVTIAGAAGSVSSTSSPTQASQFGCSSGTCQVTFDSNMTVTLTP